MDVDRHIVMVNGENESCRSGEFRALGLLLRNAGRVLTRTQLIDRIWGSNYVGDTKTLDVHVKRIRSKIRPTSSPRYLETVRGWVTSSIGTATTALRSLTRSRTSTRSRLPLAMRLKLLSPSGMGETDAPGMTPA